MRADVFGAALQDYHLHGTSSEPLLLHNSYGETEEMPVDIFFREPEDFTDMEIIALSLCDGKVLDVGAGVGSHTLYLQSKNMEVEALEISPPACSIMRTRGVFHVIEDDFFGFKNPGYGYDTLLFLMNGIGISGDLNGLINVLKHAETLLNLGGQLIFDTSDIAYLYEDGSVLPPKGYYGEISYQYEYLGQRGKPFKWLYLDQQTLIRIGHERGWVVQILDEDENDQYLVRMEKRQKHHRPELD